MTEITDLQLIDHFLQRNTPAEREFIESQFVASDAFKQKYDEAVSMWQLLGSAEADVADRDLWAGVEGRLFATTQRRGLFIPVANAPWWVRMAAGILLAVCIGYGTGQIHLGRVKPAPIDLADTELASLIDLDAFGASSIQQVGSELLDSESATE